MNSPISEYEYLATDEISKFAKLAVEPDPELDDDDYLEALREADKAAREVAWEELDLGEEIQLSLNPDPLYQGTGDAPPDVSGLDPQRAYTALQDWCYERKKSLPLDVESKLEDTWRKVKTQWFKKFNAQPYSCFFLLDYLVKVCAGMTYEEFLKDPMSLQEKCTEASISNPEKLSGLIHLPGRCTTIVLQMADDLETSPDLSFRFHDMKHHRLARCSKTGILLDTLLACGPIVLEHGKVEKRNDASHPQTFYYESGSSEYNTVNRLGDSIVVSSANKKSKVSTM